MTMHLAPAQRRCATTQRLTSPAGLARFAPPSVHPSHPPRPLLSGCGCCCLGRRHGGCERDSHCYVVGGRHHRGQCQLYRRERCRQRSHRRGWVWTGCVGASRVGVSDNGITGCDLAERHARGVSWVPGLGSLCGAPPPPSAVWLTRFSRCALLHMATITPTSHLRPF